MVQDPIGRPAPDSTYQSSDLFLESPEGMKCGHSWDPEPYGTQGSTYLYLMEISFCRSRPFLPFSVIHWGYLFAITEKVVSGTDNRWSQDATTYTLTPCPQISLQKSERGT